MQSGFHSWWEVFYFPLFFKNNVVNIFLLEYLFINLQTETNKRYFKNNQS
jgi:hypothetical protein